MKYIVVILLIFYAIYLSLKFKYIDKDGSF